MLSLSQALLWIILSVILISGGGFCVYFYDGYTKKMRLGDDQYQIKSLLQINDQAEQLKTEYIAELLGFSKENPINLYQISLDQVEECLLKSPLIKRVKASRLDPDVLVIDYEMRFPLFFLSDFENAALDHEDRLIPVTPFFTPKKLPSIRLGEALQTDWGDHISSNQLELAKDVLRKIQQVDGKHLEVLMVDMTRASYSNIGSYEIIVRLKERWEEQEWLLRLSANKVDQGIYKFQKLRNYLKKNEWKKSSEVVIFDLRLPHLAFIEDVVL